MLRLRDQGGAYMTARKPVLLNHDNVVWKRGWTDDLVAVHMAEPDVVQNFPREPKRSAERLYLKGRVEMLERRPEVSSIVLPRLIDMGAERKARQAAAMQAAADTAEIVVERMPLHELKIRALEAVYEENAKQGRKGPAAISETWLMDIAFKFAVRRLVDYDRIVAALPARLKKPDIYELCRARIDEAVAANYPGLSISVEH